MVWRIICLSCLSLAAVQAGGAGLVVSDNHSTLLTAVWLILGCLAVRSWESLSRILLAATVLGGAVYGVNTIVGEEGSILFLAILLAALALVRGHTSPLRASDLIALTAWLALVLASRGVAVLWSSLQDLAAGYGSLANLIWDGAPDRFGATASGVMIALLGLCFILPSLRRTTRATILTKISASTLIMIAPVGVLLFSGWWLEGRVFDHFDTQATIPFVTPCLFVPIIVALACLGSSEKEDGARPQVPIAASRRWASAATCLLPVALAVLAAPLGLVSKAPANQGTQVVILDEGTALHDFTQPDWKQIAGFGRTGIYGSMLSLLEKTGFEAIRTEGPLSEEKLRDADVLVIINQTRIMEQPELDSIAKHVDEGGGLLVLTDHTDLLGLMAGTNQLIHRYGMDLRFDTAMETKRSFAGNLDIHGSEIFPGEILPINLQFLHGASLRLSQPAEPLLVGRSMSGDFGDRSNAGPGAFLGDYRINPAKEQMGDVVLAAKARAGKGRVITFGDTSSFQNLALSRSSASVIDVFDWLAGAGTARGPIHQLSLFTFFIALLILLSARTNPEISVLLPITLGLVISILGTNATDIGNARITQRMADRGTFFLHDAHLSHFDRDNFQSRSIQGLLAIAEREGLKPVVGDIREVADLEKISVITLVSPTARLEQALMERLENWVSRGGTLIVSCGYEEREGSRELLARQGLEIAGIPLSAAPVRRSDQAPVAQGPKAVEAWPVTFQQGNNVRVLWASDGYPIVVEKPRGAGKFVVFGDSYFLNDRNLEAEDRVNHGNLNLLLVALGHSNGLEDVVK